MKLRLILLSVLTVMTLNSCGQKTVYIQPDLPLLTHYYVEPIDGVDYEVRVMK